MQLAKTSTCRGSGAFDMFDPTTHQEHYRFHN